MTWWALALTGAVRSNTGMAARRGLPRRSCICLNCCGVMPISPILPASALRQKQKTGGGAYRPPLPDDEEECAAGAEGAGAEGAE